MKKLILITLLLMAVKAGFDWIDMYRTQEAFGSEIHDIMKDLQLDPPRTVARRIGKAGRTYGLQLHKKDVRIEEVPIAANAVTGGLHTAGIVTNERRYRATVRYETSLLFFPKVVEIVRERQVVGRAYHRRDAEIIEAENAATGGKRRRTMAGAAGQQVTLPTPRSLPDF